MVRMRKKSVKRKAIYPLLLLGALLSSVVLNSVLKIIDITSVCQFSKLSFCSSLLTVISQLISTICVLTVFSCLLAFAAFFLEGHQARLLVQPKVTAKFSRGSELTNLNLGFLYYPTDVISPKEFQAPYGLCRVACSTATGGRKTGYFRKRYEAEWFAIVLQQPVSEIVDLNRYLSEAFDTQVMTANTDMKLNAVHQINPSLMEGTVVGPFKSFAHIQAWFDADGLTST